MAKRRQKKGKARLFGLIAIALLLGAGGALAVHLFDPVGRTIQELTLPLQHEDIIRQQSHDKGIDAALIAGVIKSESGFRPRTSNAGAVGLMQLLPGTAKFIAKNSGGTQFELTDLGSPEVNIAYGVWYLRYLKQRYSGNEMLAIAAYNSGEQNVDKWVAEASNQGRSLTVSDIPFPETSAYVQRVFDARKQYRKKYSHELGYN